MSKPDKIPIETKKGTCYYGIAASSKVRVGSYGAKKICCWLGRQIKIEKAKTEKAKRQRRQTKTEKAGGQSPYRESTRNTASRHFGLLQYLSVFNLVKWCLCSIERGPCQSCIFFQNHNLCLNRITTKRWKVRHLPVGCGLVGIVV